MSHKLVSLETASGPPRDLAISVPQIIHEAQRPAGRSVGNVSLASATSLSPKRTSVTALEGTRRAMSVKPSGIPRLISGSSQARLDALASSRSTPSSLVRSKTATSLTTIPALNRPARSMTAPVMRQPATLSKPGESLESAANHSSKPDGQKYSSTRSTAQVALQPSPAHSPPALIPELQALVSTPYRSAAPSSTVSITSSPSTRFTGSPNPWGASTATTTPVSWSSASPSVLLTARSPALGKQANAMVAPSVSRPRPAGVAKPAESRTSWSDSPQRASLQGALSPAPNVDRKCSTPRSPAPTAPPRSSSVRRSRSRSNSKTDADRSVREQPPVPQLPSSLEAVSQGTSSKYSDTLSKVNLNRRHANLQQALTVSQRAQSRSTEPVLARPPRPEILIDTSVSNHLREGLLDAAPISASDQETSTPVTPSSARSRLAKFSKLALFGKSQKDAPSGTAPKPQPRKLQRRGPSAGTGHEGYGKYGRRGRHMSSEGSDGGTDSEDSVVVMSRRRLSSSSRTGTLSSVRRNDTSQTDLDIFAASRMKPVAMRGGSQKPGLASPSAEWASDAESEWSTSGTGASRRNRDQRLLDSPLDVLYQSNRRAEPLGHESSSDSAHPSQSVQSSASVQPRVTSQSDVDRHVASTNTAQPYSVSLNTSQSSMAPSLFATSECAVDEFTTGMTGSESPGKRRRRLRWNPFRRKNSDTATQGPHAMPSPKTSPAMMAVSVAAEPMPRSVPYYAMMESETDLEDNDNVQGLGMAFPPAGLPPQVMISDDVRYNANCNETTAAGDAHDSRRSSVVAELPVTAHGAAHVLGRGEQETSGPPASDARQSRLAQVGRIPRVVPSTRRQMNRMSFSRPFHSSHGEEARPSFSPKQAEGLTRSPLLQVRTDVESAQTPIVTTADHPNVAHPISPMRHVQAPPAETYFNDYSPQIWDRQSGASSSSDGMFSVMGPPLLPESGRGNVKPHIFSFEDDFWGEYDDLLDQVILPGSPATYEPTVDHDTNTKTYRFRQSLKPLPLNLAAPSLTELARGLATDAASSPVPTLYMSPSSLSEEFSSDEFRLRRSRIVSALHSSLDPSSPLTNPDSTLEFNSDCGGSRSALRLDPFPSPPHPSSSSLAMKLPDRSPGRHQENERHMDKSQRAQNPARHSELSLASLMVSRWLSFGQVLFSPAHADLQEHPGRHVLVIDGLGSEDWSIYCSVNYQKEQTFVYDLKEIGPGHDVAASQPVPHLPAHFRRRVTSSFYDPFNFPDEFFSAIVLRFPHVMPESKLRHIIAECRRTLAPGGHMELMLLDLDIVNMGIQTRRALRTLKMQIAQADRDVSLKPMIDSVQNALGEMGFTKLSRCVVAVPVVSRPPQTTDSPTSSRSSGSSYSKFTGSVTGSHRGSRDRNFSLHDLVADHSATADAKISKIVSRTARSWWQHCFEAAVIDDGNLKRSIFANKPILSECKAKASSFKLLIAYTQKPARSAALTPRRTLSESSISTLAPAAAGGFI